MKLPKRRIVNPEWLHYWRVAHFGAMGTHKELYPDGDTRTPDPYIEQAF